MDYAFKKCPSGVMYSEIKYDGERVQVHKKDGKFMYYSRSLKPVMPHKVLITLFFVYDIVKHVMCIFIFKSENEKHVTCPT